MRYRTVIVFVWLVVQFVSGFGGPAEAQVAALQRVMTPQQRDVERARELMEEVNEILSRLPPDVQLDLRGELGIGPKTGVAIGPVSPVGVDIREEHRIAAAGATEYMILDLRGDGVDIGGYATIRVDGTQRATRWTQPGTDDAWLVVDAGSIREAGYELADSDGEAMGGLVLVSDGVRIAGPEGKEKIVVDGWSFLGFFDTAADGSISSGDPLWPHLALFVDKDGDGKVGGGELEALAGGAVSRISLGHGDGVHDPHGNTLVSGSFLSSDGSTRTAAAVTLRRD